MQRKWRNENPHGGGPCGRDVGYVMACLSRRVRRVVRADVDLAALELDLAILEREDRVVGAQADVEAGLKLGAALADDDRAGLHDLPAPDLDAAILRVAVAA